MEGLTPQQVTDLANHFLAMGRALEEYRQKNFPLLSPGQNKELKDFRDVLLKTSDDFYTLSAILVFEDVQGSLSRIGDLTNKMENTYHTLQNVQKGINIATSAVNLGMAIVKTDPKAITDALGKLAEAIQG